MASSLPKSFSRAFSIVLGWRLPLFLIACILLGGTSQNIYAPKLALYLCSILLLASITFDKRFPLGTALKSVPIILVILFIGLCAAFLIPLPEGLWTSRAGREIVVEGFKITGGQLPSLPLSLTPEKSRLFLLGFLPPIAAGALIFTSSERVIRRTLLVLIAMATASATLGLLQMTTGVRALYIYDITNIGIPVGFFSNGNHQACFLAMTLPVSIYFFLRHSTEHVHSTSEQVGKFCAGISLLLFPAIILLTGSLAGVGLLIISGFLGALVMLKKKMFKKSIIVTSVALSTLAVIGYFTLGALLPQMTDEIQSNENLSRSTIFETSWDARSDFGFWGTGPGSFVDIYAMYENEDRLELTYVPQAHNDYLQTFMETGVLGLLIIFGFLAWYALQALTSLFKRGHISRMNSILLIGLSAPILHSVVDYPLRTISISVIFAVMLCSYLRINSNL